MTYFILYLRTVVDSVIILISVIKESSIYESIRFNDESNTQVRITSQSVPPLDSIMNQSHRYKYSMTFLSFWHLNFMFVECSLPFHSQFSEQIAIIQEQISVMDPAPEFARIIRNSAALCWWWMTSVFNSVSFV